MNLEILRRSSENAAGRPAYAFPRVPRGVRAMPVKQQPRVLRGDGFFVSGGAVLFSDPVHLKRTDARDSIKRGF